MNRAMNTRHVARAALVVCCFLAALTACGLGCRTPPPPPGYDADLTPDDGAAWVGGEPTRGAALAGSYPDRAAMEAYRTAHPSCEWCSSDPVDVHHRVAVRAAPAAAGPAAPAYISLCRRCHFVIGHRCNWRTYCPAAGDIVDQYGKESRP